MWTNTNLLHNKATRWCSNNVWVEFLKFFTEFGTQSTKFIFLKSERFFSLYDWYRLACSKNIYPDGPVLKEKAIEIADKLGVEGFKWMAREMEKASFYQESDCFWRIWRRQRTNTWFLERKVGRNSQWVWIRWHIQPWWNWLFLEESQGFGEKGKECKGGKKSKSRVTVALIMSATGEKENPIVIWTSKKPCCFKSCNVSSLPVAYFNQNKAWMTGDIMKQILTKFNSKMVHQKRHVFWWTMQVVTQKILTSAILKLSFSHLTLPPSCNH